MKVLYIILSCDAYVPTRCEWVRRTWLRDCEYRILASTPNPSKGVVGWNTKDDYMNVPWKYIEFFKNDSTDADFYMFCDDDTFVYTDRLESYLTRFDPSKCLYIGYEQVHPDLRVMSGGAGFVLSRTSMNLIREMIRTTPIGRIHIPHHSDIAISLWIRPFNPIRVHESRFHTQTHSADDELDTAFTFHYVTEPLMTFYSQGLPPARQSRIKCFSFTCLRDVHLVKRLHDQLTRVGISHTMYVDESEVSQFPFACVSRGRHPDGTNGFGRGGAYAKLACIKDMVARTHPGDTILDCDSDVLFEDPAYIYALKADIDEYKGWHTKEIHQVKGNAFRYCSGAVKSYSHELATKIVSHDWATAIKDLMDADFTPSEDCTTSYIAGLEGRVTNMSSEFVWHIVQSPGISTVNVIKNVDKLPEYYLAQPSG